MIFDADTHISPYNYLDFAITAEELNDRLDRNSVDKALSWLTPHGVDDVADSNRYIYEKAKVFNKILPFGWANVNESEKKAIQDVKVCLDDYGFAGVKLNGAYNGYPIDSIEAMNVCEQIAKRNKIIGFHIGMDDINFSSPYRAAVVAKAFPTTTILMIHMGGACPDPA